MTCSCECFDCKMASECSRECHCVNPFPIDFSKPSSSLSFGKTELIDEPSYVLEDNLEN